MRIRCHARREHQNQPDSKPPIASNFNLQAARPDHCKRPDLFSSLALKGPNGFPVNGVTRVCARARERWIAIQPFEPFRPSGGLP
jgi:hypothetical protein